MIDMYLLSFALFKRKDWGGLVTVTSAFEKEKLPNRSHKIRVLQHNPLFQVNNHVTITVSHNEALCEFYNCFGSSC